MLSYRHAFHAGNHADVLKHLVLMLCLQHMNQKDKPYTVIDTHAGAGLYALESKQAKLTGEYINGIGRLWGRTGLPAPLMDFMDVLRTLNQGSALHHYPGSPWLIDHIARPIDRIRLCELHPTDFALLRRQFKNQERRVMVDQADGFEVLKAALPPSSRRALVLIDPSYEIRSDYMKVVAAIKDGLKRFATGTFLVWHPLLPTLDANQLPEKLKKAGAAHWLHATLSVCAPATQGHGMHGSGMFVINPPWTLAAELEASLPYIAQALALDERATWHIEQLEQKIGKNSAPA
jgi:23S rRNA (adenine2030-N6)-methyltransferase